MTFTEVVIAVVGGIVLMSGIMNFSLRKDRWIQRVLGETGYRILMIVIGAVFVYLALFTNYFAN